MAAPLLLAFLALAAVILQMLAASWSLQQSVQKAARQMAVLPADAGTEASAALWCDAEVLASGMPLSLADGGILGIRTGKSEVTDREIRLEAACRLRVPFGLLGRRALLVTARAEAVRWTGFAPSSDAEEEAAVLITPYGEAWHTSASCIYLAPSVRAAAGEQVSSLRNADRKKYAACPLCRPSKHGTVYLTEYGTAYHASETCRGLKRTLLAVSRSEAERRGYHPCPRCGH